jgi:hypothetical protein
LITVEATPNKVVVASPVPVIVEFPGASPRQLDAGRHEVAR